MNLATLARPILRAAVRAGAAAEGLYGGEVVIEGNRLDPEIHASLAGTRALGLPQLDTMTPGAGRAYAGRMLGAFDCAPAPMAQVIDTFAGDVPVRVYRPDAARPAMLVWFHGGGGVIGSIADHDSVCRMLAARTGSVVASVEYRLGPEHPHPAAIEDAVTAWRWAGERAASLGVRADRIGVGGDSFGGFLAAWVERRARSAGLPAPRVVALVYPLLDLTMSAESHTTFADGFLLTRRITEWFRGHYAPDPGTWRAASPMFVDDLASASPTRVVTAGFDPLRDEGQAWADRLRAAGADVTYRCEGDLVHGFIATTGVFRRCDEAVLRYCADLGADLAS